MTKLDTHATDVLHHSLGSLLHGLRARRGEPLDAISSRCGMEPGQIDRLEMGQAELTAEQLAEAIGAFTVPRRMFPEGRSRVRADLASGLVSVEIVADGAPETPLDRTVLSYLELVFEAGELPAGASLPFTALDLDVLRVVLSSHRQEVVQHLEQLLKSDDATPGHHPHRHRFLTSALAACGLAGAMALAALALDHESAPPARSGSATADTALIVPVPQSALPPSVSFSTPVDPTIGSDTVGLIPPLAVGRGPLGEVVTLTDGLAPAGSDVIVDANGTGLIPPLSAERAGNDETATVAAPGELATTDAAAVADPESAGPLGTPEAAVGDAASVGVPQGDGSTATAAAPAPITVRSIGTLFPSAEDDAVNSAQISGEVR